MITDELYDTCLPILQDDAIDDDEKTEKLEELLRTQSGLQGKTLENAVLDVLWRFRNSTSEVSSPPHIRHAVLRRASPAPWQIARASTPTLSSGLGVASPALARTKSSTASPFTSPRASPRLANVSLHIPHSPRLDAYQFSEPSPTAQNYPDFDSESVEWLVNDETGSPSLMTAEPSLNGAAAEWMQPQAQTMDLFDIIRSVIKEDRTNEELDKVLQDNNYDMSAAVIALMEGHGQPMPTPALTTPQPSPGLVIGKNMQTFRPATPIGQQKSSILCKYYLANGSCARADCRFSHDATKVLCKYFIQGSCLAGDSCAFSHDPSLLVQRLALEHAATPPPHYIPPNFQVADYDAFPSLQAPPTHINSFNASGYDWDAFEKSNGSIGAVAPPPGFNPLATYIPTGPSRPHSRPGSRHTSRAPTPSIPAVDDAEAFPSLGSAKGMAKKHHGKRGGHGHSHRDVPSTLADVVRMSPSPGPVQLRKGLVKARSFAGTRDLSASAMAIPAPEQIPWLETGDAANKAYLSARAEAIKHGGLRNKFLQSAAQAYNRNDSRAAKALSLRGQSENNLMREAHREAARALYEERNRGSGTSARELYVDLHGLHPEEAVSYLNKALVEHQNSHPVRPIYAITGTGHHSRNGKDKVGKAVRQFLTEWGFASREFSVPGDRNSMGGIIGVDPTSYSHDAAKNRPAAVEAQEGGAVGGSMESTKVRILRKEDIDAERTAASSTANSDA